MPSFRPSPASLRSPKAVTRRGPFPRSQTPFGNAIAEAIPLQICRSIARVAPKLQRSCADKGVPKWSLGTREEGAFSGRRATVRDRRYRRSAAATEVSAKWNFAEGRSVPKYNLGTREEGAFSGRRATVRDRRYRRSAAATEVSAFPSTTWERGGRRATVRDRREIDYM